MLNSSKGSTPLIEFLLHATHREKIHSLAEEIITKMLSENEHKNYSPDKNICVGEFLFWWPRSYSPDKIICGGEFFFFFIK